MYSILFAQLIKVHNDKWQKTQLPRDIYETDSIWWYNHIRDTTIEKYGNNRKSTYIWFDDDIRMSYEYIFSISWTWMGLFNTCNTTCCKENKEANQDN